MNNKLAVYFSALLLTVTLFSMDLYNPSLPAIIGELGISQALARGLVIAFFFGLIASQLIYGALSDRLGRKPILIFSLTVCALGNLLTMHSRTGAEFLFYRFITGLGAGGCLVAVRTIIIDVAGDKKMLVKGFSLLAIAGQVSAAFAPFLGGIIQQYTSWQMSFLFLFVLNSLSLIIFIFGYSETIKQKLSINARDVLLKYSELLKNKPLMLYSFILSLNFSITIAYFTISPFIYQVGLHLTPAVNGALIVFYAVGVVIGSITLRRLVGFGLKAETLLSFGLVTMFFAALIMLLFAIFFFNVYSFVATTALVGIVAGFNAPNLMGIALAPFKHHAGLASSIVGTIRYIGVSVALLLFIHIRITTALPLAIAFLVMALICLLLACLAAAIRSRLPQQPLKQAQ